MGMPRYDFVQKKEEVATGNVLPEVILSDVPIKSEPMMTEEEYQVVSFLDVDIGSASSNAKSSSNSVDVIDSDPIDVGDTDNNDMSVKTEPM